MRWRRIADPETPADWIVSTALLPLSWLYGIGWQTYSAVYRFGLKSRRRFDLPILGVGNLTVGGSGKTPLVLELLRLAHSHGLEPAVSCSGYRSPSSSATTVLMPGDTVHAARHGDEPALLRRESPGTPLILGRDRVAAACEAARRGFASLILDDGFQHLPLARTADIVLWDESQRNRRLLPAGPMREPSGGLRRASAIATPNAAPTGWSGPAFRFLVEPRGVRSLETGESLPLAWLQDREVDALCAVARPKRFFDHLEALGARIRKKTALPDHASLGDVSGGDLPTIVTEKDATKIAALRGFYTLRIQTRFENEEEVAAWLKTVLSR